MPKTSLEPAAVGPVIFAIHVAGGRSRNCFFVNPMGAL